ncbi:MAG: alanine racemase [Verrucomicrobia bacterium]|nr:alanine racemase [Verrucomicrobiota bacterium]
MSIPSNLRTWVQIDLAAFRHNLEAVRAQIGATAGIIAVVKADAYGHGVTRVAPAIADQVDLFAVANVHEADEVAALGLGREILLLGPCLPDERQAAVDAGYIVSVSSADEAAAVAALAGNRPCALNLKVDTGMGRMGCWHEEAAEVVRQIVKLPNLGEFHISTHLPAPDEDAAFTREELQGFGRLAAQIKGIAPKAKFHALNSAGIFEFAGFAPDYVRAGLVLYGSCYPDIYQPQIQPALSWKARLVLVRDVPAGRSVSYGRTFFTPHQMRIATVPVGYADGFPRQVSGHDAAVLVHGKRCLVLGRVTMDQILVDVTDVPEAQVGDEAVLIGRQGGEEILARELADKAGTISWHIFTGLKPRGSYFYYDSDTGSTV